MEDDETRKKNQPWHSAPGCPVVRKFDDSTASSEDSDKQSEADNDCATKRWPCARSSRQWREVKKACYVQRASMLRHVFYLTNACGQWSRISAPWTRLRSRCTVGVGTFGPATMSNICMR